MSINKLTGRDIKIKTTFTSISKLLTIICAGWIIFVIIVTLGYFFIDVNDMIMERPLPVREDLKFLFNVTLPFALQMFVFTSFAWLIYSLNVKNIIFNIIRVIMLIVVAISAYTEQYIILQVFGVFLYFFLALSPVIILMWLLGDK